MADLPFLYEHYWFGQHFSDYLIIFIVGLDLFNLYYLIF